MILKFIGTDNSMGLRHGKYYGVRIKTDDRYIWVTIPNMLLEVRHMVFTTWKCPYSSPQAFADN